MSVLLAASGSPLILAAVIPAGMALVGTLYSLHRQQQQAQRASEATDRASEATDKAATAQVKVNESTEVIRAWQEMVKAQGEQITALLVRQGQTENRLQSCETARVDLRVQLEALNVLLIKAGVRIEANTTDIAKNTTDIKNGNGKHESAPAKKKATAKKKAPVKKAAPRKRST